MATDKYSSMFFVLDGQLLCETHTVEWDYDPSNNIVKTQQKGFAGITPGAGGITVTVDNAVPRVGTEVDYMSLVKNRTAVEGIIVEGAKKLVSKGFINRLRGKGGVNQDTTRSFEFVGGEPEEMT